MNQKVNFLLFFNVFIFFYVFSDVNQTGLKLGIEVLAEKKMSILKGKNVGLITNITGVDSKLVSSIDIIASMPDVKLIALFSPEHGLKGGKMGTIEDSEFKNVKIYSLYGKTRRPTKEMLKGIDVLIFDIQDIGVRSYTYISTMKICMEESAKNNITFVVLDRPNPIGGNLVDGPILDMKFESFVGPAPIPYVHGMTIGEMALFLNEELNIKCNLEIIKMEKYKRDMLWEDTSLIWTPTSPHIPEPDTPFFYPISGIIGELGVVSVGVGYTLPFKIIGAPWLDAEKVVEILNNKKLKGVYFQPFYFTPFYGLYKNEECNGFRIIITDKRNYKPVEICYHILEVLINLYPEKFDFKKLPPSKIDMFDKINGSDLIRLKFQSNEKAGEIINFYQESLNEFIEKRKKYLLYD
ncbi:MAG: DUF1343 domain-containing protein [Candidatus Omnitrophica bacterium]|nr:DUF1343 domain-containing protein [Candidatus Omnitrophota bacterium]